MSLSPALDRPSSGSDPIAAPGASAGCSPIGPASGDHPRRLLIVDDERNIIAAVHRLLRRQPFELVTADSGEEALRIMEAQPVHVVISDYRMPGMNGIELLRRVQQRWPETIRIVLSGYSEVRTLISAINDGAIYKFISKPWKDEELVMNVRAAMERFELETDNRRMAREIARQNEQLVELNRQLNEHADDACAGQSRAQQLLEALEAGMLVIDTNGLIVAVDSHAVDMLCSEEGELFGVPAAAVLPENLGRALSSGGTAPVGQGSGRLAMRCSRLEYRIRSLDAADGCQGTLITLWENVE